MFCKNCGNKLNDESKFCDKCGVNLENLENNSQDNMTSKNQATQTYIQNSVNKNGKSRTVAGILGILLGSIGVHRFYLGYVGIGILQIVVTLATCGFGSLWGFLEGILILCNTGITTDAEGNSLID